MTSEREESPIAKDRAESGATHTYTYLFVYDRRENRFPERYWVKGAPVNPRAVPPEADELDGMVRHQQAEAFMARLRRKYPKPRYAVSRMVTGSWSFVEGNFVGLYYH